MWNLNQRRRTSCLIPFSLGNCIKFSLKIIKLAYFIQDQDSGWLIFNFYNCTFLHGGLLCGSESGLKTAYFVQNLDSRWLILHIYILRRGLLRGPESRLEKGHFVQNLDFIRNMGSRRLVLSRIYNLDG